ncbi:hypothetical protein D3C71_1155170 [compost metagenome]
MRFPAGVDEAEGVHAKALHHPEAARDGPVRHHPHQHVRRFGHERHEVPEGIVRGRGLRHAVVRLGLDRMDQIREFHRILDEEHGHVVAHQIPIALVRIELDRKAAHVARRVLGPAFARHGGKPHEYRRALALFGEQRRGGQVGQRLVALEVAMRRRPARMHDAFWDALVVEVRDLLAQDEILQQGRPAQPGLQRMLIVRHAHALIGRQRLPAVVRAHARQPAVDLVDAGRCRIARLVGGLAFGQGAGPDGRVHRADVGAGIGAARRFLAIFGRLVRIVGNGAGRGAHRRRALERRMGGVAGGPGRRAAVGIHIGRIERGAGAGLAWFLACHEWSPSVPAVCRATAPPWTRRWRTPLASPLRAAAIPPESPAIRSTAPATSPACDTGDGPRRSPRRRTPA